MTDSNPMPVPAFGDERRRLHELRSIDAPRRPYAEMFVPGEEEIEDGELRVTGWEAVIRGLHEAISPNRLPATLSLPQEVVWTTVVR